MNEQEPNFSPSGDEKRGLRVADFLDLYTRPRSFFAGHINLEDKRYLWFVVWSLGITSQFDRIDQEIMRSEIGRPGSAWRLLEPVVNSGWVAYWAWALGAGIVSSVIIYLVAGWWYKVRLRFAGAADPDPMTARLIYCYSTFVVSLPHVLLILGFTAWFPNYMAAYYSDELFTVALLFLILWSVAVSYSGATSTFELQPWKARLWFLALPVAFYIVLMGGVVWLLTLLQ